MVGIVVVSHSARVAEGVVEIAREMASPQLRIVPVGGIVLPDGSTAVGTDPYRIRDGILEAFSVDGVLVLVDLGSALLSAEMAIEELSLDRRASVLVGDAPLVEGTLAAVVRASAGGTLAEVAREASSALRPKIEHLSTEAPPSSARPPTSASAARIQIAVTNVLGLHARPAARLIEQLSLYPGRVRLRNATVGGAWADGRSLTELLGLAARQGQRLEVEADGPGADGILAAIASLAANGFGDAPVSAPGPALPVPAIHQLENGERVVGIPAVDGVGIGEAFWAVPVVDVIDDRPAAVPADEWCHLLDAIERTEAGLSADQYGLPDARDTAGIFATHRLLLKDEALRAEARRRIFDGRDSAFTAWRQTIQEAAERLRVTNDPIVQERAIDVEDVGWKVLRAVTGQPSATTIPEKNGVLLAEHLKPSDVTHFQPGQVRGVGLIRGTPTSHAVILLRAAGIPTVVGCGEVLRSIHAARRLLIDGTNGIVFIDPPDTSGVTLTGRLDSGPSAASVPGTQRLPVLTRGGRRIEVHANVGSLADAELAQGNGAAGIGLLRTEFLYLDRATAPTEDEQVATYRAIVAAVEGRPVTVRTLDAGGDKPLRFLRRLPEDNPVLGVRGLRLMLLEPDLFRVQLRAILRAGASAPLRMMFPMVSTVSELRDARRQLDLASVELRRRGEAIPERIDVGIMVEVPAAVGIVEHFADEIDFVSIGTNDLAQYTMAADREVAAVAGLADALQPAVLRHINIVATICSAHKIPCSICGEVAADVAAVPLLIGLGVTALSVRPSSIEKVAEAARSVVDVNVLRLAQICLLATDALAVREQLAAFRATGTVIAP